ncbi:ribonuclease D [Paraferrimonas sp. SM1919]|uniref:ribonuclease D n=1 Tax=Paraferrimonas sp. SM1919 TaxID=2662263 RepID=UPI0013D75D1B|nr:ribonuclease D [Paraferrimonas sp. SM1919]
MLDFLYIDSQKALDEMIAHYQTAAVLTIDTEFVRERTYHAALGLIQIYDGEKLALIDPCCGLDLTGFWQLLVDESITKVLHSGSEDLEIFAHIGNCQPKPLFDSQFAAALLGHGVAIGYAKLVEHYQSIELDKGESRTDWLKRPLTQSQLNYAANDVYYLHSIYFELKQQLVDQAKEQWVLAEGERATTDKLKSLDIEQAYTKVKNAFQLTPKQLAVLKPLAKWRLEQALERNLALGFILKDHALIALAKKKPQNVNELIAMKELSEQEKRRHAKRIVKMIRDVDYQYLPEPIDVIAVRSWYKAAFKTCKSALNELAQEQLLPVELLSSKKLVHGYLDWLHKGADEHSLPVLLQGWRGQVTAPTLKNLKLVLNS